ncbi:hypothetical protein LYSHEL_19220 [Lysobacter helvus]|uniref:HPt domain-containing protein n=2 Tax=Lysobacteraceae TaxID=32033 RepID=A0ABM7Q694_9GAMM|nr:MULTISPECIES: Hpt domain-containing protein [Lysobacter]BCT92898.1 hypothetical protein LYSCAS_19220 [Lysobacter caseinilyticus]BCT96051.1 hypothetical protein LYSHEL_19220 [Lysobacter helvus]
MSSERYVALRQLLNGDTRRLLRLLDMFAATTRKDLDVLDQARRNGDANAIALSAHRLKSALAQVGEPETAQALQSLEDAAQGRRFSPALSDHAAKLHARIADLLRAVEAYIASDGTVDID